MGTDPLMTMTVAPPVQSNSMRIHMYSRIDMRAPKATSRYLRTLVALAALGGRARGEEIAMLVARGTSARQVHADIQTIRRQFGEEIVPRYHGEMYVLGRVECVWSEVERRLAGDAGQPLVGASGQSIFVDLPATQPLARHLTSTLARITKRLGEADTDGELGLSVVGDTVYPTAREPLGIWLPVRPGRSAASNRPESHATARATWPMRILILTTDDAARLRLIQALATYTAIVDVRVVATTAEATAVISAGQIGGVYLDPFTIDDGIDLLAWIRDRHREVGIVLYGRLRELFELPNIAEIWRQTLQHFWRLPKNSVDESFAVAVEDTVILLFIYWLSKGSFGESPGSVANVMFSPEVAGSWSWWRKI